MVCKLLAQGRKLNKRGVLIRAGWKEYLLKKISEGTFIRVPKVMVIK